MNTRTYEAGFVHGVEWAVKRDLKAMFDDLMKVIREFQERRSKIEQAIFLLNEAKELLLKVKAKRDQPGLNGGLA